MAAHLGTVAELWRYPVKSMRGEPLAEAALDARGLLGDRAYALTDADSGAVLSMKHPRLLGRLLRFRAGYDLPLALGESLPPAAVTFPDGSTLATDDARFLAALDAALRRSVRLIQRAPPGAAAETLWPDIEGITHRNQVRPSRLGGRIPGTLYDYGPVHLLSRATLTALAQRHPSGAVAVARFRPNLLLDPFTTAPPFEENRWLGRTLLIGESVRLRVIDPCPRCVAVTLAQDGLPADPGILRTIAQTNPAVPSHTFAPGQPFRAVAGVYADVVTPGIIHPGDPVRLT